MNKILFLLFIGGFFLDFSFLPSLLGSNLSWPYFVFSLLISIFILNRPFQKNIIWVIGGGFLLSVLLEFSFFGYIVILIIIWAVIYFFENIFFNEEKTYLKSNLIFFVSFLLFAILLFIGQYIKARVLGEIILNWQYVYWLVFFKKIIIGVLVYNLVYKMTYKICERNTKVLK